MGKRDEHPIEDRTKNKRTRVTSPVEGHNETTSAVMMSTPETSTASSGTSPASSAAQPGGSGSNKLTEAEFTAFSKSVGSTSAKTKVPQTKKKASELQTGPTGPTTVQSILPHPTNTVIDDVQVAPYGEAVRKRLQDLSIYSNQKTETYTLPKLPPTATWGTYLPGDDRRNVLCNPATNKPLVIWVIGHIVSLWFARNGIPERQGSVTVLPLSAELGKQGVRLLSMFSNPNITTSIEENFNAIRAVTWQSAHEADYPELFSSVYDATEAYRAKQAMSEYDVTDLRKDDLVLVECKLTRYRTKDADNKTWSQRAQMEMLAISLLHKGVDRRAVEVEEAEQIDDICI